MIRTKTDGVLSAVGSTPLIRLERINHRRPKVRLYGKLEALNPGGSIKDRSGLSMVRSALRDGLVDVGGTVIESSSGNMAIGMAQACSVLGLKFHCVTDVNALSANIKLVRAYGGSVDVVSYQDADGGELLATRLMRVRQLLAENPSAIWINQYESKYNAMAHWDTMDEIQRELAYKVDYVFCGMSSCGTISGLAERVKEMGYDTKIIGVDAQGSAITSCSSTIRNIPGMGAGIVPKLFSPDHADQFIEVSDVECIKGCRALLRDEALLCGGSSGGLLSAFMRLSKTIEEGANCVLILPDRGERYLDTVYSDEWVCQVFGESALD
ncbi:2,3-diaminopropionate biosynthesis protein SbnA [Pelagicoccus sp. SDUM812002]|uniref:2,3-diaminopropionate biosynthesis protein SbnA n=1 Tax=Pelagicoccus sp. SDUM812002 TaxID=3041266 RepID=UPI00280F52F8|nr:2,3-diaminopropionate biosynthesis protein SbnA [Pelagicoccus sp. SDUM812002]MDQ8188498.1 2,3-diaminopropionate biosynthesis protein SbnA [Pelagicoccus sp. SDUM812002]